MSIMERLEEIDYELDTLDNDDPKVYELLDELHNLDAVLELQVSFI